MTTTTNIAEALTAITSPEHVRINEDTIEVSPANTQQISEILRYANENHLTVSPIGGGTKQTLGNSINTNIHLSLTRLNQVIEHPWQDLTCTVQAGCTWATLQQTLAKHGQFVALDPLWPERATVGGILATNDSGALRHRYGSLRDLVIGMTIVLADGTIARSGGKVVKNVAGYDLCKLLTGSLGTLAIITEATFRLHPLPQHLQTFTISAPQAGQLAPLMADIRASHLLTQALQLRGDANGFHLDIQLNAHPEAHQNDILKKMSEAAGFKLESATDEVWNARESLLSNKRNFAKISLPPKGVPDFADYVVSLGGTLVAQSLGLIYAAFPNVKQDYTALRILHVDTNSSSMTTRQISSSPHDDPIPPMGSEKPDHLMQAVKHQFDPNRTLNPGRLPGGI